MTRLRRKSMVRDQLLMLRLPLRQILKSFLKYLHKVLLFPYSNSLWCLQNWLIKLTFVTTNTFMCILWINCCSNEVVGVVADWRSKRMGICESYIVHASCLVFGNMSCPDSLIGSVSDSQFKFPRFDSRCNR